MRGHLIGIIGAEDLLGQVAAVNHIDPDFTDVKKVVNDGDPKNTDGWNLLTLSQFGGATLYQTGIELLQNDTYRLTANVKGNVSYTITASDGTVIKDGTLSNTDEFTVPAGGTYTLHFMAPSEVERYIIVEFNGKKVKVLLTGEWTEHTVTFENVKAGTNEALGRKRPR